MQEGELTKEQQERSLHYSILDGSAYSAMIGFGESFLTPFAIALGAGNLAIGILSAVPNLLGALAQPFGAWLMGHGKERKRFIVFSVIAQAAIWLLVPLLGTLPLAQDVRVVSLIVLVSVYWILGSLPVPAWTSMMGDLVPAERRGRFFGMRNQVVGATSLGAVLVGGWLLGIFSQINIFTGFAVLFGFALIARLVSAHYLSKHTEPSWKPNHRPTINFLSFARQIKGTTFGNFTLFAIVFMFTVNIAAPFFAVYMLKDLHYDYFTFGIVSAMTVLTRAFAMPYWGRLADQYGNRAILGVSSILIPLVPLLWLLDSNPVWIVLVEAFSGFIWAAFDLATFDYLMDSSTHDNRAEYFAHFSLFNGFSLFFGAAIGGVISQGWSDFAILGFAGLPAVLFISGVLRAIAASTLLGKVKEVKPRDAIPKHFLFEAAALYPARSLVTQFLHAPESFYFFEKGVVDRAKRAVGRKG